MKDDLKKIIEEAINKQKERQERMKAIAKILEEMKLLKLRATLEDEYGVQTFVHIIRDEYKTKITVYEAAGVEGRGLIAIIYRNGNVEMSINDMDIDEAITIVFKAVTLANKNIKNR